MSKEIIQKKNKRITENNDEEFGYIKMNSRKKTWSVKKEKRRKKKRKLKKK